MVLIIVMTTRYSNFNLTLHSIPFDWAFHLFVKQEFCLTWLLFFCVCVCVFVRVQSCRARACEVWAVLAVGGGPDGGLWVFSGEECTHRDFPGLQAHSPGALQQRSECRIPLSNAHTSPALAPWWHDVCTLFAWPAVWPLPVLCPLFPRQERRGTSPTTYIWVGPTSEFPSLPRPCWTSGLRSKKGRRRVSMH